MTKRNETINEISKGVLKRYVNKASVGFHGTPISEIDPKRFKGVERAQDRLEKIRNQPAEVKRRKAQEDKSHANWQAKQDRYKERATMVRKHHDAGLTTHEIAAKTNLSRGVVKDALLSTGVARYNEEKPKRIKEEMEQLDEATRKHFRAAAETIKAIEDPEKRKEHASIHADIYAKQNPRFDRAKFMKAAGVNEDEEYDDDEIEDIEDEEISSAEEIVNSAVFENPVGVKDAFTAALGDRIATRIGEIADDMKARVFASNESYIEEEDDEIDEGHSRHQLTQAAAYHRSRERGYAKNVSRDNDTGGSGKKSDLRNYRRHRDAASAAYKLMGKLDDSGKGHTSQLRKEDREDYRGQSTHLTDKDFKRIKKDYGKKPTKKED